MVMEATPRPHQWAVACQGRGLQVPVSVRVTPVHLCLLLIKCPCCMGPPLCRWAGHRCPGSFCQAPGLSCLPAQQSMVHVMTGQQGVPAHEGTPPKVVPLLPAGKAPHTAPDWCLARPASSSLTPLSCCLQTRQSAVYEMTGQQDVPEQKLDMMLVVGGFNSSNTSHLQVGR